MSQLQQLAWLFQSAHRHEQEVYDYGTAIGAGNGSFDKDDVYDELHFLAYMIDFDLNDIRFALGFDQPIDSDHPNVPNVQRAVPQNYEGAHGGLLLALVEEKLRQGGRLAESLKRLLTDN